MRNLLSRQGTRKTPTLFGFIWGGKLSETLLSEDYRLPALKELILGETEQKTGKTLPSSRNKDECCLGRFLLVNYRSCVTGYLAAVNNNSKSVNLRCTLGWSLIEK
jgi:hypothetical protein